MRLILMVSVGPTGPLRNWTMVIFAPQLFLSGVSHARVRPTLPSISLLKL